jgi:hypothetical protein
MDWIKKNVHQFVLGLFALLLLALSALLIVRALSVGEAFAAVESTPVRNDKIVPLEMETLQTARAHLEKPPTWNSDPSKQGSLFVSHKFILGPGGTPQRIDVSGGTPVHPPVTNEWLIRYDLDILAPNVLEADVDNDGYSNLDEFLGADRSPANGDTDASNPRDPESHPPYFTKLFLKQYIKVPFRLLFNAYDGDPKKPESMSFQINTLDLRQPSMFLNHGDMVTKTKFKIDGFESKSVLNPKTGEQTDVSELTLLNIETNEKIVLVLTKVTDSPDSFAMFQYSWPNPAQTFQVKKGQEFVLRPNIQQKYKLVDIKETEAVIQLPTGEKYTVPKLP